MGIMHYQWVDNHITAPSCQYLLYIVFLTILDILLQTSERKVFFFISRLLEFSLFFFFFREELIGKSNIFLAEIWNSSVIFCPLLDDLVRRWHLSIFFIFLFYLSGLSICLLLSFYRYHAWYHLSSFTTIFFINVSNLSYLWKLLLIFIYQSKS